MRPFVTLRLPQLVMGSVPGCLTPLYPSLFVAPCYYIWLFIQLHLPLLLYKKHFNSFVNIPKRRIGLRGTIYYIHNILTTIYCGYFTNKTTLLSNHQIQLYDWLFSNFLRVVTSLSGYGRLITSSLDFLPFGNSRLRLALARLILSSAPIFAV